MRLEEKHPLAIRWFHWLNFPLLFAMIYSGLAIYWAYQPYSLAGFHFFPRGFFESLGLRYRLGEGMGLHFFFMWLFALNGLAYVSYLAISGEWRELWPSRGSFKRALLEVGHSLRLVKEKPEQGKYNDAQRLAYCGVIVMGVGALLTGLAIYKPVQLGWLRWLLGGYQWARAEHFALTMGFLAFFLVHVLQVIRAGWNNFRAMVIGCEVVDE
ncbi:MAG: cytochrome b/b6 domain-containing protein [Vulcanimicrobiota bacterium]